MSVNRYNGSFQCGQGEFQLYQKKDIDLAISDISHPNPIFKFKSMSGKLYLTNKRFIFESSEKSGKYELKDFSACFGSISKLDVKQPIFGANAVVGMATGEPGDNGFMGTVDFKFSFNAGGAIDFAKLLMKTAKNPPQQAPTVTVGMNMFGQPVQMQMPVQPGYNQPGIQQPDGTYFFPAAGTMPGPANPVNPNAPPSYLDNANTVGDAPPLYEGQKSSSNGNVPPEYQNSRKGQ